MAVEALLRWRDPQDGVLAPPVFMPLAEDTGTALDVGLWVLDRALADLRAWQEQGLDVTVAVNFSMRQLQHPELTDAALWLEQQVFTRGVPAQAGAPR